MRSLLYAGAAAVAAFGLSATANATTFIEIDLQPDGGILTSGFGAQQVTAGAFTHTFNFTLSDAGVATGSLVTVALTAVGAAGDIDFSSATLDGSAFAFGPNGFAESGFLSLTNLAAGAHTITVIGSAVGGGTYTGTLNVAPVPEPATWAMMIAGIGVVGFAMRRRADRVAVSFS